MISIFSAVVLAGALLAPGSAHTQKMTRMPTGMWGGTHINMMVTDNSATIEYDCARGTIEGPLTVDSNGRFSLRGTHTRERGGPVRENEPPDCHPARYEGATDGKTMTLRVILVGSNKEIGAFELERGRQGRVRKCL